MLAGFFALIPVRLTISLAPNYFAFMIGSMFSGALSISTDVVSLVLSKYSG